jgi:hypothetical protein
MIMKLRNHRFPFLRTFASLNANQLHFLFFVLLFLSRVMMDGFGGGFSVLFYLFVSLFWIFFVSFLFFINGLFKR